MEVIKFFLPPLFFLNLICVPIQVKMLDREISFSKERNRLSSYPYLSGDTFRSLANFFVDETQKKFDTNDIKLGDIIYVKPNYLDYFFSKVHPHIKNPYILLTHNHIHSMPGKWKKYLDDGKLLAWFAKNALIYHPKLHLIPLGLPNQMYLGIKAGPKGFSDCKIITNIIEQPTTKSHLLCMNFSQYTHPERYKVFKKFQQKKYCYSAGNKKTYKEYLLDLKKSKFVLSPQGKSLDCYRIWEAVLMNCIPIIKRTNSRLDDLYNELPVLLIDDWDEINEDFLQKAYEAIKRKEYNRELIFADYWINTIKTIQQKLIKKALPLAQD